MGEEQPDLTSFASILAGVKKMREQYGVEDVDVPQETRQQPQQPEQNTSVLPRPTPLNPPPAPTTTISAATKTATPPIASRSTPEPRVRTSVPQPRGYAPSDILVSKSQTGNPLLKDSLMKITPWKFDSTILSDYYINPTLQILFLSLKYYKLRPEYIWQRLKKLNQGSSVGNTNDRALRVLLTVVDIDSHQDSLRSLLDFCIKHDLSLVLAWTFEEAGNYIVLAKQQDSAPSKTSLNIKGVRGTDYNSSVVEALTGIRLVNKTDVSNLLANCKSVKNIVLQSCESEDNGLTNIGGLGATKLKNMKNVFLEPFIYNKEY